IAQKLIWENANNLKQIKSKAEDKIHKLAYFDKLTNLPNRTSFLEELTKSFEAVEGGNKLRNIAVVAIDLDHFKDINDSMGHNVGDLILQAVGKRLRKSMPESMVVSRTGEDEFALMTELKGDVITATDIGEKVLDIIRGRPFKVFNEEFGVRASVGVATFPQDGTEPDQLLKNADIALNRAKEEGRDCLKEYSEDFDRAVQQRFQLLRDLRDALNNDGLSLHYQPQFDLKTGEIIGAEALIRWWKPDNSKEGGSFISPAEFIPIAEQSGLVVPLGQWVLKTACEMALNWQKSYNYSGRIAVNVSGVQFVQSDLVKFVSDTLTKTGIDPHKVELEVTESVFMDDIQHTIKTLQELHALGVELAIDDFGTGYSSLSYLRQFPVDRLKVDRSFVVNALNNADDAAITKTIIMLGHSLNLSVIAEGVETKEHELFLKEVECDEVQGFRYSKPVPAEDFAKLLQSYNGSLDSFDKFKS
ncbi:MAG: bifunctional diguanylate cyclase/phosphodiesterase, partial [Pseudomonadota bacterium]